MKKSPNQNPHLVTSFDLSDLFTPRGDLKKMIWGTTFGVKDRHSLIPVMVRDTCSSE